MARKGKKKQQPEAQQQQQQPSAQPQQQQPSTSQEQPPHSQKQQQQQPVPQQQQQPPTPQQQQRSPAPQQQQRPPVPQQQHRPPAPQQQQQPPAPQQQQPPAPQQQQGPPAPQQQQQLPVPRTWQRPHAPQQQQQPRAPQQQQRPPVPQQQHRPPARQQQQQPPAPQQQQPPAPQQQQGPPVPRTWQRPHAPQQQQQPRAPQQQQQPPAPQQQHRPPARQQQQLPPAPQQQQPPAPQQQQQLPVPRAWQRPQQQQQPAAPQQQHRPPARQQQQQPPAPQQQQRPPAPQQQQLPPAPQQQQPPAPQQQQRPPAPQQQQRLPAPQQQGQPVSDTQLVQVSKQLQETAVSIGGSNGKSRLSSSMSSSYMNLIPHRKIGGTQGRRIQVETNMFKIIFKPNFQTTVIHYDVVITPDKPKFLFRTIFEQFRRKHFPNRYPAFDGRKNAYSANKLPFGDESIEDTITIIDPERQQERTWKIYLKKVAVLDLSWLKNLVNFVEDEKEMKCVQALDIIFRHGPAYQFTPVGRSLFRQPEPGRVVSLSEGLDLWVGVFQSVSIGRKAYLNIDVAHKGFPKEQSVIDLMKDLCKHPRAAAPPETIRSQDVDENREKINKFLKGLKVQYELPGQPTTKRTYRVNELVECPRRNKFRLENNTMCTVEQYFLQNKNYRIQFPELPCVWVGSRNSNIHLPVELCTIVAGQVIQKKLTEDQTTNLIRYAATDTRRRKEKIMNGFASMRLNEQPTLSNEFQLSVQGEFEKVPARILQAPTLQYKQKEVNVVKGVWRAEKFYVPCDLPDNSWTMLNLDRRILDRDLYNLQTSLQQGAMSVSMTIGKPLTPFGNLPIQKNINNIMQYFQQKKKQELKLVVVVIPVLEHAYSLVKQISELKVTGGIVTQCLKSRTLTKLSPSTVTNILLKINSKLNGINHTLASPYRPPSLKVPCMLVGADVTHPAPDSVNIPSIAAVAASHDPNAFQYNIEIRLQSPREEMIQSMEEIMRLQLIYFYKKTGYKPRKIIFYRDGVSEGQLAQVMHYELSAMRRAIAKLDGSTTHTIPITFLVVQKRHHIRLFPTDKNCDPKNFNVLAGTVVDTDITHPTHIDFYLVSHASIQGTARPTKYRCICNENELSEDEIEQLTYYLCHMFARCTRSVSYPAPTYYAHLAAFRARELIRNVPLNINNLEEEQRVNMNLQMNANSPMFFV